MADDRRAGGGSAGRDCVKGIVLVAANTASINLSACHPGTGELTQLAKLGTNSTSHGPQRQDLVPHDLMLAFTS